MLESATPEKKKNKLVDLCRIRWVECHTALETFSDMYVMMCTHLNQMFEEECDAWDADTVTRATGFRCVFFFFFVSFVTAKKKFAMCQTITY